jgi:hypothetical protein
MAVSEPGMPHSSAKESSTACSAIIHATKRWNRFRSQWEGSVHPGILIKIIKFHHLPLTACPYKQPDELDSNSSAPESFQRFCWRSQIIQVADAFCPVLWLILKNQIYFTIIYIRMSVRLD